MMSVFKHVAGWFPIVSLNMAQVALVCNSFTDAMPYFSNYELSLSPL